MKPLLFIIFSLILTSSYSQDADSVLSQFLAARVGNTVYVRWTIRAGNTCEDTYVERAVAGEDFSRIGLISGICGSPDQPVTYDFTDSIPVANRINSYRLSLGRYGYSSSKEVEFIVLGPEGYSIRPNPMTDRSIIYFENPDEEYCKLSVMDVNGKPIRSYETHGNMFTVYREGLGSGIFFIIIQKKGIDTYKGKLLVL